MLRFYLELSTPPESMQRVNDGAAAAAKRCILSDGARKAQRNMQRERCATVEWEQALQGECIGVSVCVW